MEKYFEAFRRHIIGIDHEIQTPYHQNIPIVYADWTASGRAYNLIEKKIQHDLLPYVANTHTETNETGMKMTNAYHQAREIIKAHVNASEEDVLISCGSGMTGAISKFQRILGIKVHESFKTQISLADVDRPVVFITHMEHHSNQTSWLETIAEVVIIPPAENGLVSVTNFEALLEQYADRPTKIAAVTSCSNVTGIMTPYHEIAKIIHQHGGLCFVDFACSAPYVTMDMHPSEEGAHLDAIYFSPHKFLGGPGSAGVVIFNKKLYKNSIPDHPGGGTVTWTDPWGGHAYIRDIETREDGGTPGFLQTIRTAMAIKLKEKMTVSAIMDREHELLNQIWRGLEPIKNLHVFASEHKKRLGVISFYIDDLHYIAGVKLLNDRFGIQVRGGCSCAGTYGHYLFQVDQEESKEVRDQIVAGDCSRKPGWIRLSIHPTTSDHEIQYILSSIKQLAQNHKVWMQDYDMNCTTGTIKHKTASKASASKRIISEILETGYL